MSESDTPRSDRWEKQYDDWADKSLFRPSTVTEDVPDGWDRCRELERELAAAKARIAELEQQRDSWEAQANYHANTISGMMRQGVKDDKERDDLRQDAERYRFLRDYPRRQDLPDDKPWWNVSAAYSHEGYVYRGADLDAAIDAARAASAPAPE